MAIAAKPIPNWFAVRSVWAMLAIGLEIRYFGMDADKSAGSGFGRTECGAKPEPQGCGEPNQRPGLSTWVAVKSSKCQTIKLPSMAWIPASQPV